MCGSVAPTGLELFEQDFELFHEFGLIRVGILRFVGIGVEEDEKGVRFIHRVEKSLKTQRIAAESFIPSGFLQKPSPFHRHIVRMRIHEAFHRGGEFGNKFGFVGPQVFLFTRVGGEIVELACA